MISSIFEPVSRWPNAPRICMYANLPAFKSKALALAYNEGNGHPPILAMWTCPVCKQFHYYSGAETDTNGQCCAGGDKLPARIEKLVREALPASI